MFARPTRKTLSAVLFAVSAMAGMALFFSLYEPWEPIGPELIPDGSFSTPAATNDWVGWNQRAFYSPNEGFRQSPGVVLTTSTNQHGVLRYCIHDLENIPAFRVSLRAAAKEVRAIKETYQYPRAAFFYKDTRNKPLFHLPHEFFSAQKDKGWRGYKGFFPVPVAATNAQLYLANSGLDGTLTLDDVSVIPVRPRPSAPWWKLFFSILWIAAFARCLVLLKLWKRQYGVLILLTVSLILTGVLLPKSLLNPPIRKATQSAITALQQPAPLVPALKPAPAVQPVPAPKTAAPAKPKEEVVIELIEHGEGKIYTIGHFILFSLLALLCGLSWFTAQAPARRAAGILGGLALFAAATEVLQFLTADRTARLSDLGVDLTAIAIALLLTLLLRLASRAFVRTL